MGRKRPLRRSPVRASRALVVNGLALLIAIPALSYSLALISPGGLNGDTGRLFASAAVGMSAAVPANPYNTLASELDAKQAQLNQEASQLASERKAVLSQAALVQDLGLAGFFLSIIVLALVGLNFYLDMRRRSNRPMGYLERKFLVDLRP